MKRITIILLAILVFSGCNRELRKTKRAANKIRMLTTKYPDLLAEKRDTVVHLDTLLFISDISPLDTIVVTNRDTITVENERIKTVVEIQRQEVPVYRIRTEVQNDTIEIVQRDTLVTVQKEIVTQVKSVKVTPWYLILIIIGLIVGLIITIIKNR